MPQPTHIYTNNKCIACGCALTERNRIMAISVFWQRVLIGLAVVVGALLFAGIWVIIIRRRRYAAQARILEEERLDRLQTISQSLINQQKLEARARKKKQKKRNKGLTEKSKGFTSPVSLSVNGRIWRKKIARRHRHTQNWQIAQN